MGEQQKPAFTPGPWRVDPANNCDVQTSDGAFEVASTHPFLLSGGPAPEVGCPRANARLIASAPAMFEALRSAQASLVAAVSILKRADEDKRRPSRAVASDAMFRQMIADYEKSIEEARAALRQAAGGGEG